MKSIKLKCTKANKAAGFEMNNLYKGRITDDGVYQVRNSKGQYINLDSHLFADCGACFTELKSKTLKCISLDHKMQIKKSFKVGKRYQVESGRSLGSVAGYIFDEDGYRWTLFARMLGSVLRTALRLKVFTYN